MVMKLRCSYLYVKYPIQLHHKCIFYLPRIRIEEAKLPKSVVIYSIAPVSETHLYQALQLLTLQQEPEELPP